MHVREQMKERLKNQERKHEESARTNPKQHEDEAEEFALNKNKTKRK